jgi:O-antigen/teichoic acid export membrane protein
MLSFKKNVITSYAANFSNVLFQLIFIKFTLKLLGAEEYGRYAFLVTALSILLMFDLGVSQYFIAKLKDKKTQNNIKNFFLDTENSYIAMTIVIFSFVISFFILAQYISPQNFTNKYIDLNLLIIIFFLFLFSGLNSLYKSTFISIGLMARFNKVHIIINFFKYICILFIICIWQKIEVIFFWLTICSIFEFFFKRKLAISYLKINYAHFSFEKFKFKDSFFYFLKLIQKTFYLSLASWLGVLIMQIDKLYLASRESPSIYAFYSIASLIGFGFLQFTYPIITSLQHKLIEHKFNSKELLFIFKKVFGIFIFIFVFIMLGYFFFLKNILYFWVQVPENVDLIYSLSLPILLGSFFNFGYNFIYQIWIARDLQKLIFYVNLIILVLLSIFFPYLYSIFGIYGLSYSWLIYNSFCLVFALAWVVYQKGFKCLIS